MRLVTSWLKIERTSQGVRRIPLNVRSLTGSVLGQDFESSLERDLLLLVHWDHSVEWYQSQPVQITYNGADGNSKSYTPDLLISYQSTPEKEQSLEPLLCEVKYREDLMQNWRLLKPKFKAARQYAREQGYQFRILTEREIRTDYLKNVQFLWAYRFAHFHQHHYEKLRSVLFEMEETDPDSLLSSCYSSQVLRGEALWTLWCMVARRWIRCDLHQPLSMKTRIWLESES